MRLVKVFVVSGASQTCFRPSSRTKLFPLGEDVRKLFKDESLHLLLPPNAIVHERNKEREERS